MISSRLMKNEILDIYVRPGSSVDSIDGWHGKYIKIRLAKAPQKGKANKALIKLIASKLNLPPQNITILSGHRSNYKQISIKKPLQKDIISELLQK
jgi:uncharacterized protein (TIGR00251 family)